MPQKRTAIELDQHHFGFQLQALHESFQRSVIRNLPGLAVQEDYDFVCRGHAIM